jgi:hypothetical protein
MVVSTVAKFVEQTWTAAVRAALIQSDLPSVPAPFQEVIGSGHVRERMKAGASPLWTNTSRTTFTCPFRDRPGLRKLGVPPQASSPRPLAAESGKANHRLYLKQAEEAVFSEAANATLDKTSDGD